MIYTKDTITVIELLIDIANGKEVPDYIIWDERIYEKDLETDYTCYIHNGEPRYFLNDVLLCELNDKIKIPSIKLVKAEENIKKSSSVSREINRLKDIDEVGTLDIDVFQVPGTGSEYIQINHDLRTLKNSLNNCIRRINLLTNEIRSDK